MGAWGTGPVDSDMAADFVDGLAGMSTEQVIEAMTRTFQRVVDSGSRVDGGDGAEVVAAAAAAAALIACQIPGSQVVIDPDDGPAEPLPVLPISLRPEAGRALRRVLEDGSELAEGWVETTDAEEWRAMVQTITRALGIAP
ncbi:MULTISPECIES: DUF4259 domain-containing protein [unclassified Streptomyces]|uniref:DUF4259 domain-containing protein n=1 Tax=unclassified Streptomyces TaxID=2593676 RepID=UPI002885AC5E|nr:DUF4259 domain-containing protein [Streptomyces sp. DSM 41633]